MLAQRRQRVVMMCGGPLDGLCLPLRTPDVRVVEMREGERRVTYMQSPAQNVFTPSGLSAGEIERRERAARNAS